MKNTNEPKNEAWMVMVYNELDEQFGCEVKPQMVEGNCDKAYAKSLVRHLNKTAPDFVIYFAEPEPERFW